MQSTLAEPNANPICTMTKKFTVALSALCICFSTSFAQQYGKYTLYSLGNTSTTQLVDTNGGVFKTWTHASNAKTGYSSYLMPGGVLWRSVINAGNQIMGGGMTGKVQKVAWDGTVLWTFTYSSATYCLHHDICPLPNGNVLLISYDVHSAAEATQAGASQNILVWSDKIIEVKPTGATTGEIVWQWRAWDHLVQNVNSAKDNYQTSIVQHPERLNINYKLTKDWIHMNGLDYNPITDQIAFSSHYLNEWYVIDHSTSLTEAASATGGNSGKGGDLLYRFGNPIAYGATGTQILKVTHDVHWIPEGIPNAGRLVGFNNQGISSNQSCIDQITPPANGYNFDLTLGQAFQPTTYQQRTACNGYSSNMSNSYQLPNGNMLICMATLGTIYEISPTGTTLWTKSTGGNTAQAFRYTECYVNNDAPVIPTITAAGNVLTSSVASTYQWYKNGAQLTGETGQSYTTTGPGIYVVRATNAAACETVYSYSTGYKILISIPLSVSASAVLSTVCAGDKVQLNATATGGTTTTTWQWTSDPAGFISDLPNPIDSPSVNITYKVVATNGTEVDSVMIPIIVNPIPDTPLVTQTGNELASTTGAGYLWYLNGLLQTGLSTQTISPTTDGNYQVRILDLNGCKSALSDTVHFIYTSVSSVRWVESLKIYPNPSQNRFTIQGITTGTEKVRVTVFDTRGRLVYSTENQTTFDLTGFPPGVYHLMVQRATGENAHFQIHLVP